MTDLNVYTCTGRLGADPDCRKFGNGDPVVNLRVAVSETWKQDGERREKTLWMPVKITNKGLCSVAENYLRKGARVGLMGKLESRSYDRNGVETWVTELVLGPFNSSLTMLDGVSDSGGSNTSPSKPSKAPAFEGAGSGDDVPF